MQNSGSLQFGYEGKFWVAYEVFNFLVTAGDWMTGDTGHAMGQLIDTAHFQTSENI